MKATDLFPSKYLKAEDLEYDVTAEIDHVTVESMKARDGVEEQKAVIYFKGTSKGLVVNKTNWRRIVKITGREDSDDWPGHKIVLYKEEVDAFGDLVDAIRVRGPERTQQFPAHSAFTGVVEPEPPPDPEQTLRELGY